MDLVFAINAHKNPQQIVRLVRGLNGCHRHFLIHIDKKTTTKAYSEVVEALGQYRNVTMLKRHRCNWWDFGQVRTALKAIDAITAQVAPCDYMIFITGQDYPIKSNDYIDAFLTSHQQRSFISYSRLPFPIWSDGGHGRYENWHFTFGRRVITMPSERRAPWYFAGNAIFKKRCFPCGLVPYGAWAYWCLSGRCIEFIKRFLDERPEVVRFFRHVIVPDEMFFQSILLNSPLRSTIWNTDLHFIKWDDGADHPRLLTCADFEQIRTSNALFARKFDASVDSEILDLIDRERGMAIADEANFEVPSASLPVGDMCRQISLAGLPSENLPDHSNV